jgi:ElaB/YqjD/DUF883 family membrane-anchored ribosome-binding protein
LALTAAFTPAAPKTDTVCTRDLENAIMSAKNHSDLSAIGDDVALLKRDLSRLMNHVKNGTFDIATESTQEAVERLSDEADRLYRGLAKKSARSVKAISRQVEEQPLTSLLVAFGVGLIGGRLLSR